MGRRMRVAREGGRRRMRGAEAAVGGRRRGRVREPGTKWRRGGGRCARRGPASDRATTAPHPPPGGGEAETAPCGRRTDLGTRPPLGVGPARAASFPTPPLPPRLFLLPTPRGRRSATRRSRHGGRRPRPRGAVKAVSAAAVRAAPPERAGQEDGGGRRRRRQGLLFGRVLLGRRAGGLARQEAAGGDQHHGVHPGPLLVVSGEQTAPQHHRLPLDEVAAAL